MFFLIAGLGNPGNKYQASRHNVGSDAIDLLAKRHSIDMQRSRFSSQFGDGLIRDQRVLLLKPQTYMNLSGEAIQPAGHFYKVPSQQIIVLHDDMDLTLGRIQVRLGGGDGGHRGVRSTINCLGSAEFIRIRMGIGRPAEERGASGFVLGDFDNDQLEQVEKLENRVADAVEVLLSKDLRTAMNRFNRWKKAPKKKPEQPEKNEAPPPDGIPNDKVPKEAVEEPQNED